MADVKKVVADVSAKADSAESKVEAATGIKGSSGNWFSAHPALLVIVGLVVVALVVLKACVG
jgi:hypothetical protein